MVDLPDHAEKRGGGHRPLSHPFRRGKGRAAFRQQAFRVLHRGRGAVEKNAGAVPGRAAQPVSGAGHDGEGREGRAQGVDA